MAAPSRPPTFKAYGVDRRCSNCGSKLTVKDTRWFQGYPFRAVYGLCCWSIAAHITEERKAA